MTPKELFDATNKERESHGRKSLEMDEVLMDGASAWAGQMFSSGRLRHASLDGFNGENIAWGQESVAEVIRTWMLSPGHRMNMLSGSFTKLGVGFCGIDHNMYWVQRFK